MLNENLLNEGDILNAPSMTGEKFTNGNQVFSAYENSKYSNGAGDYITPENINATINLATQFAKNQQGQGECKKPLMPESFYNRGNWNRYKDCLRDRKERQERQLRIEQERRRAAEEQKAKAEAMIKERLLAKSGGGISGDKILGMPKGLAIGLGVTLGVAVLGLVAYKIVKG